MLKTLIKKQILETFSGFIINKKNNKARTKSSIICYSLLYLLVCASMFYIFFTISKTMCKPLVEANFSWLYFAIIGSLSITLGIFGSVFNTYSTLYKAKDNNLLLSLPIKVSSLLFARLCSVWLWGLLFSSLIEIPALIAYWTIVPFNFLISISQVLSFFASSILILLLSSILGYIIAKISNLVKNKSITIVLLSILFIFAYYFVYSKMYKWIAILITNANTVGSSIKKYALPLYTLGTSYSGKALSLSILLSTTLLLFGLIWWILLKSFYKITTSAKSFSKSKDKSLNFNSNSIKTTLLKREFKRYFSLPTYILNNSLATILAPLYAILLLVKGKDIFTLIQAIFPSSQNIIIVFALGIILMLTSMNNLTAPSISLEGKTLWLIKSLPFNPSEIFLAKINMQLILTIPVVLLVSIVTGIVLKLRFILFILLISLGLAFTILYAIYGLILNLKFPNFHWKNETFVIKQGMPIFLSLILGLLFSASVIALAIPLLKIISIYLYLLILLSLFILIIILLILWLNKKGPKIFLNLN